MKDVDTGGRDRLAVAVLVQYRMATTVQIHLIVPGVRIEQARRRLMKLRREGLADRITLPQAGRTRVWYPTPYGSQIASEWPELRGRRPPRGATHRTAVRLKAGHGLTVTDTALACLKDARHHGQHRGRDPTRQRCARPVGGHQDPDHKPHRSRLTVPRTEPVVMTTRAAPVQDPADADSGEGGDDEGEREGRGGRAHRPPGRVGDLGVQDGEHA